MSKKIQGKRKRDEIDEDNETEELGSNEVSRPKKKLKARNTKKNDDIQDPADLAENEPQISSGQNIATPTNLAKIVKERNAEFVTNDPQWKSSLQCPLASPKYNVQRAIQDKFELSELFPTGTNLLGYSVTSRRHRNVNFLLFLKVAKWCWANGRSVPYEVEVISNFPVHTIPQPIMWASVDDNKYHVIIFNEHFHCPTSAIRKLRQHTFDFIQTLQYIHEKGYVHGDIKLENTSCDMDTDDFHLFDFDHSCKISEVSARHFGTQGHRAPEYLRTRKYTIEAEMFSLGIWLIESFFQRNVQTILSKYRPNFSIDNDELNAFKILLEIFEEYTSSKPYEEMWIRHCEAIRRHQNPWTEININETQFQHLRTMIRDLLNEDPAKRPSCQELLTDPKYTPFLDTSNYFPLVIPKETRERVTKHKIYSPQYVTVNRVRERGRY